MNFALLYLALFYSGIRSTAGLQPSRALIRQLEDCSVHSRHIGVIKLRNSQISFSLLRVVNGLTATSVGWGLVITEHMAAEYIMNNVVKVLGLGKFKEELYIYNTTSPSHLYMLRSINIGGSQPLV